MRAVLTTNDPVLLNFATALLAEAGIDCVTFDANASLMDGSIGAIPRRLMVADDDHARAARVLREAGAG